jgi:hypothetical protein
LYEYLEAEPIENPPAKGANRIFRDYEVQDMIPEITWTNLSDEPMEQLMRACLECLPVDPNNEILCGNGFPFELRQHAAKAIFRRHINVRDTPFGIGRTDRGKPATTTYQASCASTWITRTRYSKGPTFPGHSSWSSIPCQEIVTRPTKSGGPMTIAGKSRNPSPATNVPGKHLPTS